MTRIPDLLPEYKEYLRYERRLADATVWAYMHDLRALDSFCSKDVEKMTRGDLRAFIRHLTKAGYKATTVRRTAHGLSTFWKWLYVDNRVGEVITSYLQLPRKNQPTPQWMSANELKRFVAATEQEPLREGLAWRTLAYTGMRPNEMRLLRVEDVQLHKDLIIARNTKSRCDRALPLPPALYADFGYLLNKRPATHFVFGDVKPWGRKTMYDAFNGFLVRAGFAEQGWTPYVLRHTFATLLADSGVPDFVLKELMGHKDIRTTQVYLHAAPANLRDAMSKFVLNEKTE